MATKLHEVYISALSKGRTEGISVGQKQATKSIARAMLSSGVDIPTISQCTGLSIKEIEEIK